MFAIVRRILEEAGREPRGYFICTKNEIQQLCETKKKIVHLLWLIQFSEVLYDLKYYVLHIVTGLHVRPGLRICGK